MAKFLMNVWYMGAWSHEVTEVPMARTCLGVPMLFYRLSDGKATVLHDRCPHRFVKLSKGKVVGDNIRCAYHGLVFGPDGRCVEAPLSDTVPDAAVKHYPVAERDNILWFWPGNPNKADPATIPDFPHLNDPDRKIIHGLTSVNCHYEVETDNLMDPSHVNWVHPPLAGTVNRKSTYSAFRDGDAIHSNWFTSAGVNPPIYEYGIFPTKGGPVDQWVEMRWHPPGAVAMEIVVTRTGELRADGLVTRGCHILTPETERTTLYFWSSSIPANDPLPLEVFHTLAAQTFDNEDKPMIEDADEAMDSTDLLSLRPLVLPGDKGAIMARRTMAALIKKEQGAASDGPSPGKLADVEHFVSASA